MVYEDTIEIFTLWNRVKDRFSLTRSQPKSFTLGDTVHPVTLIDYALDTVKIKWGEVTVTENGWRMTALVPSNKRWKVYLSQILYADSPFNIDAFGMNLNLPDQPNLTYDTFTATTDHAFYHPTGLMLVENMYLTVKVVDYVSDHAIRFIYLISETSMEE